MPQINLKSTALPPRFFAATFVQRRPRDEHQDSDIHSDHRPSVIPAGDSLPQDRNEHKSSRTDGRDHSVQQFTDIPPPIPDNGPLSLSYSRTTLLPYSSFLSARSSSLMALHPLTSATTMLAVTNRPLQPSESVSSTIHPSNSSSPISLQHQAPNSPKIPIPVIISVAVSVGLFIVAGIIFLRVCKHPRPRERPKPSLPILDYPFVEEDMCKFNESPLFGGQERFSTNSGNNSGLWAWTQYPQVKSTQVPIVQLFPPPAPGSIEPENRPSPPPSAAAAERSRGLLAARPPPSQSVPTLGASLLSVSSTRQDKATNSAMSLHRLSDRSLSLYPNSPVCTQTEASFSAGRPSRSDGLGKDESSSSRDIAYDGADIASPQFFAQDLIEESPSSPNPSGSRSRIKSSYFSYTPGSYPRMSSVQSGIATSKDDDFDLRKLPPIHKSESDSRREKAFAAALGVTSPSTVHTTPLSPPATLYPDDSLSVVDAKRSSRRLHRKPTPNSKLKRKSCIETSTIRTSLDSSTALGSLMLMEFGATSKSSGMLSDNNFISSNGRPVGPPRVPSPPPLPSLAQMGLEHANPEGYGEYRSATYSICGLYEGDRKSRMG
ncbi:hypothetical protein E1B28_008901 [Marasmius oreades]|uniref:Uncharacterized protein n=1 Tax=Marasmius oreades TaxID=181124 RepID=A0A9P7US83_9AGAR|nr:uncharacterized protein E1B28_008901 [Marasmius oreades]KAG7092552.1 hypothetical protein E1B28_008901 [Marasmius oreades]